MRIFLPLFLGLLLAVSVSAAEKKDAKKKGDTRLSDTDLEDLAKQELRSLPARGKIAPPLAAEPASALVSTEVLEEEITERFAASEFELGAQPYKPSGFGRISNTESYPLDRMNSSPMALMGLRQWFLNSNGSRKWRAGLSLDAGLVSQSMKIRTQSGAVFDDVRLSTVIADLGPEAEYFFGPVAFGLRAAAGRIFSVQSTNAPILNRSQQGGIWSLSPHLRYQPAKNFFAKLAYARRAILGGADGLGTQESNLMAFIGFGM